MLRAGEEAGGGGELHLFPIHTSLVSVTCTEMLPPRRG